MIGFADGEIVGNQDVRGDLHLLRFLWLSWISLAGKGYLAQRQAGWPCIHEDLEDHCRQ